MKNKNSGSSRDERYARIATHTAFSVIDNDMVSLLKQAAGISGFLRYYSPDGRPDGYFSELLPDFNDPAAFYSQTRGDLTGGNTEPSQALLLSFIENLQHTTTTFNSRWGNYPSWYLTDKLGIKPLPYVGNKVWIAFNKKPLEKTTVQQSTRFKTYNQDKRPLYYKLDEDVTLHDTVITKAYLISYEKDKKRYPEQPLDFVTGISFKEFAVKQGDSIIPQNNHATGVRLTSPALLLREGTRQVTLTFYNQDTWNGIIKSKLEVFKALRENQFETHAQKTDEELLSDIIEKVTKNMFCLSISTTKGWSSIDDIKVSISGSNLAVSFTLPESFPATTGCLPEIHNFYSRYPRLDVKLNDNAWLYPYSWIKDFLISRVIIETNVRGIKNIQVYNELGQVDTSKPFPPFGINNKKGAWFAVGNYEMAVKQAQDIDVFIKWKQLPEDEMGLKGYYARYNNDIDNASFRLQSRFLADYNWRKTHSPKHYLFSSVGEPAGERPEPDDRLLSHNLIQHVNITGMPALEISEKDYRYTTKARSGFVDFTLVSPDMGFGEAEYRKLFTEQLMNNVQKIYKYPDINAPVNPLAERIMLNYRAKDIIHVAGGANPPGTALDYILPADTTSVFPENGNKAIPFAIDTEPVNLLLALKDAVPGSLFSVYFDFTPLSEEVAENNIPAIQWYVGHGRNWNLMKHSFLHRDETRSLSVNGHMQFLLPEEIDASLFDNEGLLWIRAGLQMGDDIDFPMLNCIHTNVGSLSLDVDFTEDEKVLFKHITASLEPEKNIPGVLSINKISSFYGGREAENDKDMLIRISEYITHRGRAVTHRDYERITLQAFRDIARVKCYRGINNNNAVVYVAVLPFSGKNSPMVANKLMIEVQRYLSRLSSAYATKIKVTNPIYQKIMVRAVIKFEGGYLPEEHRKRIILMVNKVIAPWYQKQEIPEFNHSIDINKLRDAITEGFNAEINILDFETVRFSSNGGKYFANSYNDKDDAIHPPEPNVIFIPAKDHIILIDGQDKKPIEDFGIDEMTLGDTFIIQ